MAGIFLIQSDEHGTLTEMTETAYDSEDMLQTLLAKYPNLLAGDQINSEQPRRWLLVAREARLPSEEAGAPRWSVDHLFLDQDGIPTLVEVKRSTDTRIRREVVGQMLDYAANAVVYWPINEITEKYENNCEADGCDPNERLQEFLLDVCEPDEFWQTVKTNLDAGRIRMVFVADFIPNELQRIVEFLNIQMNPAEVLAVQIKQYAADGFRTLVPRVIGQTAVAQQRRSQVSAAKKQWDEESFIAEMSSRLDTRNTDVARTILKWAIGKGLRIVWGRGTSNNAGFYPNFDHNGSSVPLVGVRTGFTTPYLEMQFKNPRFRSAMHESQLQEFLDRLNTIPEVNLPLDSVDKYARVTISALFDDEALSKFMSTLEWVMCELRSPSNMSKT